MSGPLPISCMANYKLIECAYARRVFPIALREFRDLHRVDYAFRERAPKGQEISEEYFPCLQILQKTNEMFYKFLP